MVRIVLGSGLLRRGGTLLLVRGHYEAEPQPLWTLPGGRQEAGETIGQTVVREFMEEASLAVRPGELAYVSESLDAKASLHVINCTFWVAESDQAVQPHSSDPKVAEVRFVPIGDAPGFLGADVLRIPVAAALDGRLQSRYFLFEEKDIAVPFFGRLLH